MPSLDIYWFSLLLVSILVFDSSYICTLAPFLHTFTISSDMDNSVYLRIVIITICTCVKCKRKLPMSAFNNKFG